MALAGHAVWRFLSTPDPLPIFFALGVAAMILVGARFEPVVPFTLIVVPLATAVAEVLHLGLDRIGELPAGFAPASLAFLDLGRIGDLLPSALAVAALAPLESLLCATVADSMSIGERHDPDRELFGQGIANLVAPIFGGVPATAAIARTAVNVRAGAQSRLSSVTHAATLAVIVLIGTDLVSRIPLAALAGVLLATCVQMIKFSSIIALVKSTRTDAVVLILTFAVAVAIDLVTAVAVGLGVAVLLALRTISRSARLEQVPLHEPEADAMVIHTDPVANRLVLPDAKAYVDGARSTGSSGADPGVTEHALLTEHIVAYRLDGPLFFGVAHRFLLALADVATVDVVILRMSRISTLDATGARVLDDAIERLERRGIVVLVSEVQPEHIRILRTLSVAPHLQQLGRVFAHAPAAIAHAHALLGTPRHDERDGSATHPHQAGMHRPEVRLHVPRVTGQHSS